MNEQQAFWAQDYAKDYIQKNSEFNQALGIEAWERMIAKTSGITSVLECGCNIGRNIGSLNTILPQAEKSIIEISQPAFQFVTQHYNIQHGFHGSILESNLVGKFDLVFTMGVLIHIHPDDLIANMQKVFSYSKKYLLIGEYFNRTPVMIEYQGQKNRLFKRDFGKLFLENFSAELIDYGFVWGHIYDDAGFDDITWWLFEKR